MQLILGVAILFAAIGCVAQTYPSKPIRLVVPFAAGGAADVVGRLLAQKLNESLAQQVVVDNRAGANGVIGVDAVAKSPPDGYTVVLTTVGSLAITPHLQAMPYDALKDLTPVSLAVKNPLALVAHVSVPAKTVADLVRLAKARPGRLTAGSSGNGSINHLALEQFKMLAGVDITHVAYKGEGPGMTDLVGGQIDLMVVTVLVANPFVNAGRIRALATLGERRPAAMPDIPTLREAGITGYRAEAWLGLLGPAGMSRDVVTRLNGEAARILRRNDVKDWLLERGSEPVGSTPEEFAAYLRDEYVRYGKLVKTAGIRLD